MKILIETNDATVDQAINSLAVIANTDLAPSQLAEQPWLTSVYITVEQTDELDYTEEVVLYSLRNQ